MVGIILVSHSSKITAGLFDLIDGMVDLEPENELLQLETAGGTDDDRLGTSAIKIYEKIEACRQCLDIFVFCDMGSAYLSAEMAQELCDFELEEKVNIIHAPLIDGAFCASVQASIGKNSEEIMAELDTEFSIIE